MDFEAVDTLERVFEQKRRLDTSISLSIGNFDGLHLGHQALLREAKSQALTIGARSAVLSFEPPPQSYFNVRKDDEHRLFDPWQKQKAFCEFGMDFFILEDFNETFSLLSPHDFVKSYLVEQLNIKHLTIGHDFRFGHKRTGSIEDLVKFSKAFEFGLSTFKPISLNNDVISSSKIRTFICQGNMQQAARFLGRPYLVAGKVVEGKKLARTLGFPTANIDYNDHQILPQRGVYAGWVGIENIAIFPNESSLEQAVINIGLRPTVDSRASTLVCEVHLLNHENSFPDLYGQSLAIYFKQRIRDEKKFSGLNELRQAIIDDIRMSKKILD